MRTIPCHNLFKDLRGRLLTLHEEGGDAKRSLFSEAEWPFL